MYLDVSKEASSHFLQIVFIAYRSSPVVNYGIIKNNNDKKMIEQHD